MYKNSFPAASFMAVAHGSISTEPQVKRYKGIGAMKILALNPSRAQINAIYGSDNGNTEEPVYVAKGKAKDKNGIEQECNQIRLTFYLRTDPAVACNNNIDAIIPVTIFLSKAYSFSNKGGVVKVQVMDRFGRTAWVTEEELKAGAIPEYKIQKGERAGQTMKASISEGYRPCYVGEADLVAFVKALLNIPNPTVWDENSKTYFMRPENQLPDCECRFDKVNDYFSGNIKELQEILTYQPENRIKLCFGVRTTSNGTQYQCAYLAMPMKLAVTRFDALERALEEDRKAGRHPSEDYDTTPLHEVTLQATDYAKKQEESTDPDPFANVPVDSMPMDDLPAANDADPFAN